ncbi:unnamed protein product [Rotaria sp. Silwood1]|nr:unnamed protein product [Rotaria sp. Silwood1]CAF5026660.1 unnamed protein product [Rotaria sp. Silwood1]
MNIMWMAADIADEIQSYENPPSLRRDALRREISRILQRARIKDRSRCDAPLTVRTEQLKKAIKRLIYLKNGQSERKVIFELQRNNIEGFHNSKNDVIYAEDPSEIPVDLREASIVKYPTGVMFWNAITTKGLIPQDGPINFTQWSRAQCPLDKRKRMYMTSDLYAKFLREEAIPIINEVVENLNVIFQDDQDSKHRTKIAMDAVNDFFEERIEPNDGDAKFADV